MNDTRYDEPVYDYDSDGIPLGKSRQIAPYAPRQNSPAPYQRIPLQPYQQPPVYQPQQSGVFIPFNSLLILLGIIAIVASIYLTSGRSGSSSDIAVMVLQQQLQETQGKLDAANQQIAVMSKEMGAYDQQLLQAKDNLQQEQIRKAAIEAQLKEASKGTFTRILEGLFGQ